MDKTAILRKYIQKIIIEELSNKNLLNESLSQAQAFLKKGLIKQEEYEKCLEIDPTKNKNYVGWLLKLHIDKKISVFDEEIKNYIETYEELKNKGKIKTKNIIDFKTFDQLKNEIDGILYSGKDKSRKEKEIEGAKVYQDDENLYIVSPETHEAAQKLGRNTFDLKSTSNGTECPWCICRRQGEHWNQEVNINGGQFYFILVKSEEYINKLRKAFPSWSDTALSAISYSKRWDGDGSIQCCNGENANMSIGDINTYLSIIGVNID